jgi:ankyrin repeat/BTB/POZ domain-containing protein 1
MLEEEEEAINQLVPENHELSGAVDWSGPPETSLDTALENQEPAGVIRTLDGEIAGDEFAQDALNYQILLNKIDNLLDRLKLDA